MSRTVTIPVEFTIETMAEEKERTGKVVIGGFKIEWMSAKQDNIQFELTCGAGCGNSAIEAMAVKRDGDAKPFYIYAKGDIRSLAETIFAELQREVEER